MTQKTMIVKFSVLVLTTIVFTLTIYDTTGAMVRRLKFGGQPAGFYTARSKATYWNGRSTNGESVASGVYFYQLRADDYSALRRMVIIK